MIKNMTIIIFSRKMIFHLKILIIYTFITLTSTPRNKVINIMCSVYSRQEQER